MRVMFDSYQAARDYMSKARSRKAGRPVATWGRLVECEDAVGSYELRDRATPILRIHPDNTLEFVIDGIDARQNSNTLSMCIHDVTPLVWHRIGVGRYRVAVANQLGRTGWNNRYYERPDQSHPEVFSGLKLDLTTMQWTNQRLLHKRKVIPAKRREWLRDLKAWKRTMKTRIRLGAYNKVVADLKASKEYIPYVDWHDRNMLDILYKAIKDNTCDAELMRKFAYGFSKSWSPAPTTSEAEKHIDRILSMCSLELRSRYGVFEQEE